MRKIMLCAAILACAACQNTTAPGAAADTDFAASTQAIELAEKTQASAVPQKYLGGATALYADDAVFIGDDGDLIRGKPAIRSMFKDFLAGPAIEFDVKPGSKTFSSSGDMAYSTATYTETYTDPKTNKVVTLKGTNLSVWKKQADGSWKLVADSNPGAVSG